MGRRAIALLVAVILALIGTVSLISYVRGIEKRTLQGAQLINVFVAKESIPKDTLGKDAISKGLIAREAVPRRLALENRIQALEEIQDKVTAVDIFKGQQIIVPTFITPSEALKGRLPIPPDRQAISVEVALPPGVAGFVEPGSHVSIIAKLDVGVGQESEVRVAYLLQDVVVLAVGQVVEDAVAKKDGGVTGATEEGPQQRGLFTLSVTPGDAEKLAYAVFHGQLYFTLLPPGQAPVQTSGRTRQNAFL